MSQQLEMQHAVRFRSIKWVQVLRYQRWGDLILLVASCILLAVTHYKWQANPHVTPAYVYDASLAYPYTATSTISNGVAAVFGWVGLLLSVAVTELVVMRGRQSLTTAMATALGIIWGAIVTFVLVLTVTEMIKPLAGVLRPNFLSRCLGPGWQAGQAPLTPSSSGAIAQPVVCASGDQDAINDGRLSFVSGHASNTLSIALFTAFYLVWSMYWRARQINSRTICAPAAEPWWRAALGEAARGLGLVWLAAVLVTPIVVGITRLWDFQHSPADLAGGMAVALTFVPVLFAHTIGQHAQWAAAMDAMHEDGDDVVGARRGREVPLSPGAGEGGHSHTAGDVAASVAAADVMERGDGPGVGGGSLYARTAE